MILLSSLVLLAGCVSGPGYLWKQGRYLISFSSGTRDAVSMLRDPATKPATRAFLEQVAAIRRFAVEEIGLRANANFTRYKEIDRDYLVSVVQACDAVSFARYEWRYPLLGRLPYKGFYERADAEAEAARLEKEGFDVIVRKVDAFSTLGFLKDPLYSFMKKYSTFRLASLIIHEQTHATVFLKGQPQFNEELADFVGEEGALDFLGLRSGPQSAAYREAVAELSDEQVFLGFLRELSKALDAVYDSSLGRQEKLEKKKQIIDDYKARFAREYLPRFGSADYRAADDLPLNNAYISLYSLYTDDVPLLKEFFRDSCGADLRRFMEKVSAMARGGGDVKETIRRELAAARPPGAGAGAERAGDLDRQ